MRRAVTGMALAAMLCGAPAARGADAPPGGTADDAAAVGGGASAPVDSTPHAALGWTDLLREEETLRFETGQSRLQLAHAFLQFGSEVVATPESLLVRNRDYGIDYSHGLLFLLRPAASTFECRVTYLHLPGPRQQQFHAAEVLSREEALASAAAGVATSPGGSADLPLPATAPAGRLGPPPSLQLGGSNTIGVSFGANREATLEQALRVQVAGKLGEDLSVNAVLSDDNLPVLPEGNTEELGDLNRVFIELQGPVVGGVVGDFDLTHTGGEFVRIDRQLRGGEGRVRFGPQQFGVSVGLARGEHQSATFRGTEGKQGPYDLLSARRVEQSTILPGSERVYLDGELLRRGESQDYVIDYVRGELRFNNRRRITSDSEIGLDYQVSSERFRRQARASRLDLKAGAWGLQGFFLHEGDDRDHPVDGDLTADEIALLEAAGDDDAVAPGVKVVGAGHGLYRWAPDSTHVLYDPTAGDLDVRFYEAGSGQGSYEDKLDAVTGQRFFEFRGPGLGPYAIGHLLSAPNRTQLAAAEFQGTPWKGGSVRGEAAWSDFDRNLFSSAADRNNTGEALDLKLDTGDHGLGFGNFGWDVHVSQLSPRFHAPDRIRTPYYYKEWNAEQDSLRTEERLAETTLRYALGGSAGGGSPWVRLATNLGWLDRGADLATRRAQADLVLGPRIDRGIDLRYQLLDTDRPGLGPDGGRSRRFARGGARWRLGPFLPEVHIEGDEFVRADVDSTVRPSYRYLDTRGVLGLGGGRLHASLEVGRRDTDARRTQGEIDTGLAEWEGDRRNDSYGVSVVGQWAGALNTEISWSRRTQEPLGETATPASRTDLARAVLGLRPRAHAVRGELRYEISDEQARKLEQVLVLAPDGKGDYDAEGRPVGKDQGEYDKVYRYLGETENVNQVESSLRIELGGALEGRTAPAAGWRRHLALVQVLSVQEQTRSDATSLYLLMPSAFQGAQTIFGSFRARQEWSFLETSTEHSLRLFLDWQDDLDGRFAGTPVDAHRGTATLRYQKSGPTAWTWGGETELGNRDRSGQLDAVVPGRPSADSYDIRQGSLVGRVGYRMSASQRLGLDLSATQQRDQLSETLQHLIELTPEIVFAPVVNFRIFATLSATRVFETRPPGVLPPYLFDAPGTRMRGSLNGTYRVARYLDLNLNCSAMKHTDGRSTYDVKAETRAIF